MSYAGALDYGYAKTLAPWEIQILIETFNDKVATDERLMKEAMAKK